MDYTLGAETRMDPYHIPIVRTTLTRALADRFSDIKDEIIAAFNDIIPPNDTKGEHDRPYQNIITHIALRVLLQNGRATTLYQRLYKLWLGLPIDYLLVCPCVSFSTKSRNSRERQSFYLQADYRTF